MVYTSEEKDIVGTKGRFHPTSHHIVITTHEVLVNRHGSAAQEAWFTHQLAEEPGSWKG